MKNGMFVYRLPTGKWRMYYYEVTLGELRMMESDDLYVWKDIGKNVDCKYNSTNVFQLGGYYWMTIDTYCGYAVFRSDDCENWTRQDGLLFDETSEHMDDGSRPHHSGVVELPGPGVLLLLHAPGKGSGAKPKGRPKACWTESMASPT